MPRRFCLRLHGVMVYTFGLEESPPLKLVVQLPALNEEATLAEVLARIPRTIQGIHEVLTLVVDDGSTDATGEIARAAGARVVRHETSRGVGAAFRSGIAAATEMGADIVVTIDADGQFNPEDIPKLIHPILEGEADFVTASRFIDKALTPDMPRVKRWGNDFMARWISTMVNKRFYDVSCGFRAYSRNAFLRLILIGDFTYTHEVFLSLAFAQVPIREVPIVVRGVREHGESRVAGSIFRYGRRTASIILKTYRDYKPLRFFTQMAAWSMLCSTGFFGFLLMHKIRSGGFFPHKWAGFAGGAFAGAALTIFLVGIVAEMLDRMRVAQEESVFQARKLQCELRDLRELRERQATGSERPSDTEMQPEAAQADVLQRM